MGERIDVEMVLEALTKGFDGMNAELRGVAEAFQESEDAAKKAAEGADDHGDKSEKQVPKLQKLKENILEVKAALDLTKQAYQAIAGVMKFAYESVKEGAALNLEADRFDKLTVSIGSTADAMMGDLRRATGGMVKDSELILGANDIIRLGLADTQEGVTDLSTVITKLGWDMQTVILTFANNSKARLDSLGLSVADVDARTEKFIALGYDMDKAFDMAVIEAGKDQIVLLGDAADSTVGDLQKLEAAWGTLGDVAKQSFAEKAGPALGVAATAATQLAEAQRAVDEAVERGLLTQYEANTLVLDAALGFKARQDLLVETVIELENVKAEEARLSEEIGRGMKVQQDRANAIALATAQLQKSKDGVNTYRLELRSAAVEEEAFIKVQETIAARREAGLASFAQYNALIDASKSTVADLTEAEQLYADSQGEWVEQVVDNTTYLNDVQTELARDLTREQQTAMQEVLKTADEGGGEWLAAYQALQGDLTDTQRQELIVRQNELETASGTVRSVYTGDAVSAEEAQERIATANAAISASYKQIAEDALKVALAETIGEDGLEAAQAMIAFQESMGTITPEQAEKLNEIAIKSEAIRDASSEMFAVYLEDGILAQEEADKVAEAITKIEESALGTEEGVNQMSAASTADLKTFDTNSRKTRNSIMFIENDIKDMIDRWENWTPSVKTLPRPKSGGGDKDYPESPGGNDYGANRAGGGSVLKGQRVLVGEQGPEVLTMPSNGNVTPHGMTPSITYNDNTIINNQSREAAALTQAIIEQSKRDRVDSWMGVE